MISDISLILWSLGQIVLPKKVHLRCYEFLESYEEPIQVDQNRDIQLNYPTEQHLCNEAKALREGSLYDDPATISSSECGSHTNPEMSKQGRRRSSFEMNNSDVSLPCLIHPTRSSNPTSDNITDAKAESINDVINEHCNNQLCFVLSSLMYHDPK